jgi:hypothetical protein
MIEETGYGYRLAYQGGPPADAAAWLAELRRVIRPRPPFSVLLDLRGSRAFRPDTRELLSQALAHCRAAGMARAAQVLDSALTTLQAAGIARDAGLGDPGDIVLAIDATLNPGWEEAALAWLSGL